MKWPKTEKIWKVRAWLWFLLIVHFLTAPSKVNLVRVELDKQRTSIVIFLGLTIWINKNEFSYLSHSTTLLFYLHSKI